MKKLILLFTVLFLGLIIVFYKIQPENIYLPSLVMLLLFCNGIKLLYNQNEKKKGRFLPVGKAPIYKADIYAAIVFMVFVVIIGIISNNGDSWMHIDFAVFYGVGFIMIMLLFYKSYVFAMRNKKVIFNGTGPFAEKWLYNDIQQVVIESEKVVFIKSDGTQKSCDVRITEEEKSKMIHILARKEINIIL